MAEKFLNKTGLSRLWTKAKGYISTVVSEVRALADTNHADTRLAVSLLVNHSRQNAWNVERGTVTLTNTLRFPFNGSKKTVALAKKRDSGDYTVLTEIVSFVGCAGEIEVSDRLTNGFKLAFTGGASKVVVSYTVFGGMMK